MNLPSPTPSSIAALWNNNPPFPQNPQPIIAIARKDVRLQFFFTVFCNLDVANRNSHRIICELRAEIRTPKAVE